MYVLPESNTMQPDHFSISPSRVKVFEVELIIIKLTVPLPNKLAINCRLHLTKISAFAISNITKCIGI